MILILLGVLLIVICVWWYRLINHWKFNNVPYVPSYSIFGNFKEYFLFRKSLTYAFNYAYNKKEMKNVSFFGIRMFHMPVIMIKDPELIKQILVKDFHNFTDRLASCDAKGDPVGNANPFIMNHFAWRKTRTKLSHLFTLSKMRKLFNLTNGLGMELNKLLFSYNLDSSKKPFVVEIKDLAVRYTTDNIASVAFGVQGNALKDPNSAFRNFGKKILATSLYRIIEFGSCFFLPQLAAILKFKLFSKETSDFMRDTINGVIEERAVTGEIRDDLIDTLVTLRNEDKDKVPGKGQFRKNFCLYFRHFGFYSKICSFSGRCLNRTSSNIFCCWI